MPSRGAREISLRGHRKHSNWTTKLLIRYFKSKRGVCPEGLELLRKVRYIALLNAR